MKCRVCGYEGYFGSISYLGEGWTEFTARYPKSKKEIDKKLAKDEFCSYDELSKNVGAVDIWACPECGTLVTDFGGRVKL